MQHKHRGAVQLLFLVTGVWLIAVPYPMFFIPNDIAPGGVVGVATLLHALLGAPVGATSAAFNIPLFLLGWKRMGRGFAAKSLAGMICVSVIIDLVPIPAVTWDPMLAAVFGGVLVGVGLGLMLRGGATTGGTDLAAALIHERFPIVSVGGVLMAVDCCVILASGFVFSIQSAMYALISLFLSAQVMDRVIEGFSSAKAFFVFSEKSRQIADETLARLGRGATLFNARGAYSDQEVHVLLCVITRLQIPQFKSIVEAVDPTAFVMLTDVREAMGEGFTRPPADGG